MPKYQTLVAELNGMFSPERIEETAERREEFAPGQPFANVFERSPLHRVLGRYLSTVPYIFTETVRSVAHHALSTKPPTPVTFAWAPAYDFELTLWQAPDTAETRGGITVLVKSRYPDDAHPLATS